MAEGMSGGLYHADIDDQDLRRAPSLERPLPAHSKRRTKDFGNNSAA